MGMVTQFDEKPRITGLLNNCLLNSALPNIIKQILAYSEMTPEALEALDGTPVYEHYKRLKSIFAETYGISEAQQEPFDWIVFNQVIQNHNFYANEILFAPVLRAVVKDFTSDFTFDEFFDALHASKNPALMPEGFVEDKDEIKLVYNALQNTRSITPAGRYPLLQFEHLYVVFYHKLGLNLTAHTALTRAGETKPYDYGLWEDYTHHTSDEPNPRPTVDIYFKDNHYERQRHEDLSEATEEYTRHINELPEALSKIHGTISGAHSRHETNRALGELFAYGNQKLQTILTRADEINSDQKRDLKKQAYQRSAAEYVASIQKGFSTQLGLEKQTSSTILLTLLQNAGNQEADLLLSKMRIASGTKRGTVLAETIFKHWANLDNPELQKLASTIEEPSSFYFNCMVGLAVAGAALLVAAILLQPMISMPFVIGLAAVGATSLLVSGGMFAAQQLSSTKVADEPEPSPT
ncbi:MAG: hypothetical protein K0U37_02260 [Gammaproteobacteria bacterium]|nr:hypothetical protein [Gammaproteobacteria bacterium]